MVSNFSNSKKGQKKKSLRNWQKLRVASLNSGQIFLFKFSIKLFSSSLDVVLATVNTFLLYWLNVQKCPNDVLLKELWRRIRNSWPTRAKYTSNYSELQLIVGHIPHLTLHPWTLNIVLAKCCAFHNIYRSHGTCSHVGRFVERGTATRFTIANSLNVKTVFLAWSQIQGTHLVCFKAWDKLNW